MRIPNAADAVRALVGLLGVGVGLYGLVLLLDLGTDNLLATATWVVGGIVVHDAVLAPATIAVAVLAGLLLRRRLPGAWVGAAVVLATVTVVGIPVLGRFGARADNPTLLDRDYAVGWAILAVACVAGGIMGTLVRRRAAAREER